MTTLGLPAFTERLLDLLDTGRRTSTYKYALLLGMIDSIASHTTAAGKAPAAVSVRDLAPRIIAIYWQQTLPWGRDQPNADLPLRQNNGGQAEIVARIVEFRDAVARSDAAMPFGHVRKAFGPEADRLIDHVRWKLIQMPIPRLQRAEGLNDPFIYEIGWDENVSRAAALSADFDDRLRLVSGAGEHLLSMAPLIRPLVQRSWALAVARMNHLEEADYLEQYLFDARRLSLGRVHTELRDLHHGRCFYCGRPVTTGGQIDHFIPWSRHFDNSIQNLVYAHDACNNSKRAYLASADHLANWVERMRDGTETADALRGIAAERGWESRPNETLAIARGSYLKLTGAARLWSAKGPPAVLKPASVEELKAALSHAGSPGRE